MRKILIFFPLLLCARPAFAQETASPQLPPELTDPATAQRLANTMQALSNALLNVRLGGVKAALEGREATPQEKNLTVRDMARRKDPNFDRDLQRQVAQAGPTMQRSMKALNQALPSVMQGLADAQQSIERAVANMPDPTYPRR
jgi:hypothetical protein